jgi:hypothetical protein
MRWMRLEMAKNKTHRALRRVQVGRGDGWLVWTESLDCCCCGYAQEAGASMAIEECNSLGLCVRLVSSARQEQRNEKERTGGSHGEETSRRKDIYQRLSSGVREMSTRENITDDMTLKYLASWPSKAIAAWAAWALVVVESLSLFAILQ